MTYREDVEGQDASILMHPRVWEASGHVENFTDPMVDCKQCKSRFRLDVLGEAINDAKKEKIMVGYKTPDGINIKNEIRIFEQLIVN